MIINSFLIYIILSLKLIEKLLRVFVKYKIRKKEVVNK